jgi:hypothetical protein
LKLWLLYVSDRKHTFFCQGDFKKAPPGVADTLTTRKDKELLKRVITNEKDPQVRKVAEERLQALTA